MRKYHSFLGILIISVILKTSSPCSDKKMAEHLLNLIRRTTRRASCVPYTNAETLVRFCPARKTEHLLRFIRRGCLLYNALVLTRGLPYGVLSLVKYNKEQSYFVMVSVRQYAHVFLHVGYPPCFVSSDRIFMVVL